MHLRYDPGQRGTVVLAGTEQSEVRWDGDKRVLVHSNSSLVRAVERVRGKNPRVS